MIIDKEKYYRACSLRLMRYLYGLGFDKTSDFYNGKESWIFERSPELDEALKFFFYMRKKIRDKADK